jgi:hypothetical protein
MAEPADPLAGLRAALGDGAARPRLLASLPKLSFHAAVTVLAELVGRQHADARAKLAAPDYWGGVGPLVEIAAAICERTARLGIAAEGSGIDFDRLLTLTALARRRYAEVYDDADGYGAATFAEFVDDVGHFGTSQAGLVEGVACLYAEMVDVSDFSESFAAWLVLPPAWHDFANALAAPDMARAAAQAAAIDREATRPDLRRLAGRLRLLTAGDGDAPALPVQERATEGDIEDLCDDLVAGRLLISAAGLAALVPVERCRALFWDGVARRRRDEPLWRARLADCAAFDSEAIECILASSLLGVPWTARELRADVALALAEFR